MKLQQSIPLTLKLDYDYDGNRFVRITPRWAGPDPGDGGIRKLEMLAIAVGRSPEFRELTDGKTLAELPEVLADVAGSVAPPLSRMDGAYLEMLLMDACLDGPAHA